MDNKADMDNHSNQMNPNNDTYWNDRGYDDRPDDWDDRVNSDDNSSDDSDKK